MYNGEVTLLQEELDSFLEAGGALGVKGLDPGHTGQGAATGGAFENDPWQENQTITSASPNKVHSNKTTGSTRHSTGQGFINGTGYAAPENTVQSWFTGQGSTTGAGTAVKSNTEHGIKTEFIEDTTEVFNEGHCDYDNNREGHHYGEINILDQPEVIVNPTSEQKKNVFQKYISVKTVDRKKVGECQICGKKEQRYIRNLLRHVENCHLKGMFRYLCRHCPKELDTASKLCDHERSAHIMSNTEHVIKTELVEDTTEVIEGHCDYDDNQENQNYGKINILNQPEVIMNPTSEQQKNMFQKYTSVKTVGGKK